MTTFRVQPIGSGLSVDPVVGSGRLLMGGRDGTRGVDLGCLDAVEGRWEFSFDAVGNVAKVCTLADGRFAWWDGEDRGFLGDAGDPQRVAFPCTRLAEHPHPDANLAARELRARSSFAVLVAFQALRRARELDHGAVLNQDLSLMARVIPVDFVEGVGALHVAKDHAPEWRWSRLEDVATSAVATEGP